MAGSSLAGSTRTHAVGGTAIAGSSALAGSSLTGSAAFGTGGSVLVGGSALAGGASSVVGGSRVRHIGGEGPIYVDSGYTTSGYSNVCCAPAGVRSTFVGSRREVLEVWTMFWKDEFSIIQIFSQAATVTQHIEKVPVEIDVDIDTYREIVEVPIEKIVEVPYPVEKIVQVENRRLF